MLDRYEEYTEYTVGARNEETLVWPVFCSQLKKETSAPLDLINKSLKIDKTGHAVPGLRYQKFTHSHSIRREELRNNPFNLTKRVSPIIDLANITLQELTHPGSMDVVEEKSPSEQEAIKYYDEIHPALSPKIMSSTEIVIQSMTATDFFYIVGKVDGVSQQLDMSSMDANEWSAIDVVIEVKNRVHKIPAYPPHYDQIQLVAYMLMLGCIAGDLVESVTRKGDSGSGRGGRSISGTYTGRGRGNYGGRFRGRYRGNGSNGNSNSTDISPSKALAAPKVVSLHSPITNYFSPDPISNKKSKSDDFVSDGVTASTSCTSTNNGDSNNDSNNNSHCHCYCYGCYQCLASLDT